MRNPLAKPHTAGQWLLSSMCWIIICMLCWAGVVCCSEALPYGYWPLRPLLLLAGLGLSIVLRAQEHPRQPIDTVKQHQRMLTGFANPHYLILAKATPVYFQPADTLSNRVAKRLQKGKKVYIRKFLPTGYLIALPTREEQHYYLPAKSARGLQVYVEI
ncbi:MAG: hypothetical protein EOO63_14710 [Hymenobacter sp.]|nr:MAG: hypothetical protein EOO63_14710 [Hymenobacter sp.]